MTCLFGSHCLFVWMSVCIWHTQMPAISCSPNNFYAKKSAWLVMKILHSVCLTMHAQPIIVWNQFRNFKINVPAKKIKWFSFRNRKIDEHFLRLNLFLLWKLFKCLLLHSCLANEHIEFLAITEQSKSSCHKLKSAFLSHSFPFISYWNQFFGDTLLC